MRPAQASAPLVKLGVRELQTSRVDGDPGRVCADTDTDRDCRWASRLGWQSLAGPFLYGCRGNARATARFYDETSCARARPPPPTAVIVIASWVRKTGYSGALAPGRGLTASRAWGCEVFYFDCAFVRKAAQLQGGTCPDLVPPGLLLSAKSATTEPGGTRFAWGRPGVGVRGYCTAEPCFGSSLRSALRSPHAIRAACPLPFRGGEPAPACPLWSATRAAIQLFGLPCAARTSLLHPVTVMAWRSARVLAWRGHPHLLGGHYCLAHRSIAGPSRPASVTRRY